MTCLMSSLDVVEPLDEVDGELQEDGQLSQEAEELRSGLWSPPAEPLRYWGCLAKCL